MEWSKMKNMILMILVVTNLILLAFVLHRQYQTNRMQEQARSQAILFLAERGVQVEEDVVPARISLQPQTAQRDLEQEGAAAARLLGEATAPFWLTLRPGPFPWARTRRQTA